MSINPWNEMAAFFYMVGMVASLSAANSLGRRNHWGEYTQPKRLNFWIILACLAVLVGLGCNITAWVTR